VKPFKTRGWVVRDAFADADKEVNDGGH
jgi:hypothetical protein